LRGDLLINNNYAAVAAKCRCLFGQMMDDEKYGEMLKLRSVGEAAAFLMENPSYGPELAGIDPAKIHRGQLEYIIRKKLFGEHIKLYNFMFGSERKYLGFIITKFEMDYMLGALRSVLTRSLENYFDVPVFVAEHSKINFNALFSSQNTGDFLEAIRETTYHAVLEPLLRDGAEYTTLETAVYNRYYFELYRRYSALFGRDTRRVIEGVVGVQCDLINIARIARLKKNFTNKPEEIYPYIIPISRYLSEKNIRDMLACESSAALTEYLETLPFARRLSFLGFDSIHEYMKAYLYKYYRRLMRSSRNGFEVPLGYLYLKEIEMTNIICIIEGIRYSEPPRQIRRSLVGCCEGEDEESAGSG